MARKKWEDMSTNDLDALYDKCKDYDDENKNGSMETPSNSE